MYFVVEDTVTVNTPHSSCVSIVGTEPLTVDRVPHVGYLKSDIYKII